LSLEGSFLHLLLTKPELITEARRYVAAETLTDGVSGDIYSLMLELYDEHGNFDGIIDHVHDTELQRLISLMLVKPALEEHIHEELVQKIIHLGKKFHRAKIRDIKVAMKNSDADRVTLRAQLNEHTNQLGLLDEGE
jgi:ACT domain-containing protein